MGVNISQAADNADNHWVKFPPRKPKYDLIHHRSRVLQKVDWKLLWNNFLDSSLGSFAISQPEMISLLESSPLIGSDSFDEEVFKVEIKEYIDFIQEIVEPANCKVLDFLSVCSSVLFLSEDHLDSKIDMVFSWLDLNMDNDISADELYLGVCSFEIGMSFAMGLHPVGEKYLRVVSQQWFSLGGSGREADNVPGATLTKGKFFDFCTNRQQAVRRLLEYFTMAKVKEDRNGDLQEVATAMKLCSPSLDEPTGGDEWMSNPTWKKTAQIMTPANYRGNPTKPASMLTLDWVHGYRGFDCRNNVCYVGDSTVVFSAAALGVVQDIPDDGTVHTQRYFGEHTDDIVSLSVSEPQLVDGNWSYENITIATGEMGKKPAIYVWRAGQMLSLACMRGSHAKAVTQLAHSQNGEELFSVGLDYTVAVYSLLSGKSFGKQLCSAQGPKGKVLHACAVGANFVSCGEKHICFWLREKSSVKCVKAKLPKLTNKMYMSATSVQNHRGVVVGASDGTVLLFDGVGGGMVQISVNKTTPFPCVNSLWSAPGAAAGFILGGKDGSIWKVELDVNLKGVSSHRIMQATDWHPLRKVVPVRSACLSADGSKLLVGTQTCDIIETSIDLDNFVVVSHSRQVVNGHFKDELWGLAVRPPVPNAPSGYLGQYVTVGDDKYMRVFSVADKRQLRELDMGTMARCCAYSPDGDMLAVGFGGRVGRGKAQGDGMFRVYRLNYTSDGVSLQTGSAGNEWFTMIHEARDAKQWITDIKFSADCRMLAVGSKDNSIYVYNIAQQFKLKFKFSKHNSYITHFDMSEDGKVLQSNCGAYELLFCNLDNGKPIQKGSSLSDAKWATMTCPLGWQVQGIWPSRADGTDINAVDRSPSGELIATADDFGNVKVFRFPAVQENSEFNVYAGHSSHVTNCRWVPGGAKDNYSDEYLISLGGNDKCVFQWKNHRSEDEGRIVRANVSNGDDEAFVSAELEEPSGGDEFMAIKPWKGAIKAPSHFGAPDETRVVQFFAALGDLATKHSKLHAGAVSPNDYKAVMRQAGTVFDKLVDSGYASKEMPDQDEMELAWVHGYRGFDCRNNIRYDASSKKIIYFTANLGIVLTHGGRDRKQQYFRGHTDDILSMGIYADASDTLVVTGQRGKANTFVWSSNNMELKATLQTNQKSIAMLEFSKDGRLVISIGEDNTVAVTEWANQRLIASVKGEPAATYHMVSSGDMGHLFLTCGDKYMRVWSLAGRNLTSAKLSTSPKGKPQKFLAAALFGDKWIIGCENGWLYVITKTDKGYKSVTDAIFASEPRSTGSNTAPSQSTKGKGKKPGGRGKKGKGGGEASGPAITSMYCTDAVLLTGSKDGCVYLWGPDMNRLGGFDVRTIFADVTFLSAQIQSLCFEGSHEGNCKILIGTRGCDMLEVIGSSGDFTAAQHSPVLQGHCNDELWGLAVHPKRPEYCTVGDDKTLRVWDIHDRKMVACNVIGTMARACAYHPSGMYLAVGFGGRVGRGKQKDDGMIRVYEYPDDWNSGSDQLVKQIEMRDSKQWISDLKFSPDGGTMAAGSHDNVVYIYTVAIDDDSHKLSLSLRGKFNKHNSYITHLDFSADGRFLQSNCGAYELLFCETSMGKQITTASELRDVRWQTWTCTLGWPVQGIWPVGADGTDINAVDRSNSGHLIATSDDFGNVRVLRYPCVEEGANALVCSGHSSHVMNVRWTLGDEYLISCGGNDKSICQWKHTISTTDATGGRTSIADNDDYDSADGGEDAFNVDPLEEPSGGDEFMAVKPWRGAIRAPEVVPPTNPAAPSASLDIQWVHGYTSGAAGSGNSRISSNLFYGASPSHDIIYPAAALGVRLTCDGEDRVNRSQQYFTGHDDDILCLTISPCKRFVATGQTASKATKGKGSICVWDSSDCRLLSEMKGCHQRGVISLAFNSAGDKLVSVGLDNSYHHTLWSDCGGSWSRVQQVVTQKSDQKTHLFTRWISPEAGDNGYHFVSGGATNVHFWKIEGSALTKKESRAGKYKQKPILCAANLKMKGDEYRLVTGTSQGDLYVFAYDRECKNAIEGAHEGAILTLAEGVRNEFIISGGMDKCIRIWNRALQAISHHKFDQSPLVSPVNASVASIDYRTHDNNLVVLVGTYGGEIIEVIAKESEHSNKKGESKDVSDGINFDLMSACEVNVLVHSHYSGELWGVAPHPTDPDVVATGGDDGTVRLWSISQNKMVASENTNRPVRCVGWSPDGRFIAVGFHESKNARRVKTAGKKKGSTKGKKAPAKNDSTGRGGSEEATASCFIYMCTAEAARYRLRRIGYGGSSKAWISDIKFSPSGSLLAMGSHDKRLYVYSVPLHDVDNEDAWAEAFESPKYTFNKHSSAVTHFDFSEDESYFQTNCQAYELLFGEASTGRQKTSATELRNYNAPATSDSNEFWSTWTCVLGWPVQGIWAEGADGSDINSVDRSLVNSLIATADDFGLVKLFRYPCIDDEAKCNTYRGHSSHVTNVRWTKSDLLVSVGGNDKCLFVWKLTI